MISRCHFCIHFHFPKFLLPQSLREKISTFTFQSLREINLHHLHPADVYKQRQCLPIIALLADVLRVNFWNRTRRKWPNVLFCSWPRLLEHSQLSRSYKNVSNFYFILILPVFAHRGKDDTWSSGWEEENWKAKNHIRASEKESN